jgi:hypothetical protein
LAIIGFFLSASDSLVSGTAAQDLCDASMAGRMMGSINGVGAIGAALQGTKISKALK